MKLAVYIGNKSSDNNYIVDEDMSTVVISSDFNCNLKKAYF